MDWFDDMDIDPPFEVLEKIHRLERAHLAKKVNNVFCIYVFNDLETRVINNTRSNSRFRIHMI